MARLRTNSGVEYQVDDSDVEALAVFSWCWHASTGYLVSRVKGENRNHLMHRFLMNAQKGQYVDHINGDKLDNRRENLRLCTNSQNMQNSRKRANNTSGYKGVWWNKCTKWWYAAVKKNYKSHNAGHYRTPEEAARAYDALALELHGEFAYLNFPEDK